MPDDGLVVHVTADPDADEQELAELTGRLREELLELDVDDVELVRGGEPPAGAKGLDVVQVGELLVSAVTSSHVLSAIVGVVQSWLARARQRSVKIEIDGDVLEVGGLSSAEQQRLIDQWIAKHGVD